MLDLVEHIQEGIRPPLDLGADTHFRRLLFGIGRQYLCTDELCARLGLGTSHRDRIAALDAAVAIALNKRRKGEDDGHRKPNGRNATLGS